MIKDEEAVKNTKNEKIFDIGSEVYAITERGSYVSDRNGDHACRDKDIEGGIVKGKIVKYIMCDNGCLGIEVEYRDSMAIYISVAKNWFDNIEDAMMFFSLGL